MNLPDDLPMTDSRNVDVRVLVPLWIGGELFKVGDISSLPPRDMQALRAAGRVEPI